MNLSIEEILKATGGTLKCGDKKIVVQNICTDTRKLKAGDFYVALKGPRFDGHDFVGEALTKGASGILVSQDVGASLIASVPIVQVVDTLKALGDLAQEWRSRFQIPVVGITGSSGKTTTKDLIAGVLSQKGAVLKTEGNLNNLIGLPLTLFGLSDQHRFAVLEMGMNAFGEIARLTEISQPTIGLITNVGHAHLEGVKSIEGVAKAKEELFAGLGPGAVAVVNADDARISSFPTPAKKITFGYHQAGDIRASNVDYVGDQMKVTVTDPRQTTTFVLPLVGEHHVMNWLACYTVCYQLGVTPLKAQAALDSFRLGTMRGEEIKLKNDMIVVNDAYNANPDSMEASLLSLKRRYPKRRLVAVLGEMWELGEETGELHEWVGEVAAQSGIELLIAYGKHSDDMIRGFEKNKTEGAGLAFRDLEALNRTLLDQLKKEDAILVKGSRGSKMERVVEFLKRSNS